MLRKIIVENKTLNQEDRLGFIPSIGNISNASFMLSFKMAITGNHQSPLVSPFTSE